VQTGKVRRVPLILVGTQFWRGMTDWIRDRLAADGMVSPEDLDLLQVLDDPRAIVDAIFDHYHTRGFAPTPSEREAEYML